MAAKLTYGEWTALLLSGMALGPDPKNWALVPVVAAAGVGAWALRRSDGFRRGVEATIDVLEDRGAPDVALSLLERLAVPPVGQQLALPQPRRAPPQPPVTRTSGLGRLSDLWGEEGGDHAQPTRTPIDRTTQRLRNPEGSVTRQIRVVPTKAEPAWPQSDALRVMPIRTLVETVNNDPDTYPFLVVFGPARSGKTTLIQLIAATRPGKVVILDPKRPQGFKGPKWGGLPYVSKDEQGTYKPMVAALRKGYLLMEWRYKHQETATKEFEPVTFIIDEAKTVVDECPEIADLYKAIYSRGAEARVRIILASTTDRARKLGFEGEADSLEGFVPIRLGVFAKKVLPEVVDLGSEPHRWAVANFGEWVAFDNSKTARLLKKVQMRPSRVWNRVRYNCQVPNWDSEEGEPVEVPQPAAPVQSLRMVSAAKRRPAEENAVLLDAMLELPAPGMSAELQAELARLAPKTMARHPEVSNVSASEIRNHPAETELPPETRGSGHSEAGEPGTEMTLAKSQTWQNSAKLFALADVSDRKLVLSALRLFYTNGNRKKAAICEAAGIQPGREYLRLSPLFDAAVYVYERKGAR